ncbi:hypothetical protein HPP92_006487 [Vanilla planifolia]|uniref:Uncharacterized protein n=1 Tax=Vanilla planifolia TaxID=51239 RepID=A0A835V6U0_VANPL|nr:hypothetical protein HPP92_006487 [Vanilla planifolia]
MNLSHVPIFSSNANTAQLRSNQDLLGAGSRREACNNHIHSLVQNPFMAICRSYSEVEHTMDNFWFNHNILLFQIGDTNTLSSLSSPPSKGSKPGDYNPSEVQKIRSNRVHLNCGAMSLTCGFMDLDLMFNKEKLSPHVLSMVEGLSRTGKRSEGFEGSGKQTRRISLDEAWLSNRTDSALLNLRLLAKSHDDAHIKRYLKSWARRVASSINQQ